MVAVIIPALRQAIWGLYRASSNPEDGPKNLSEPPQGEGQKVFDDSHNRAQKRTRPTAGHEAERNQDENQKTQ
jgi:hypothetical protein